MKSRGLWKISISILFSELEKIQKYKELGKNMFFIGKKSILNSLGILPIPQNFWTKKVWPFDVLPKQTTCEIKAFQVQDYIQQWFHDEQGAKFLLSFTFLVWSEMTSGIYLTAGGWLKLYVFNFKWILVQLILVFAENCFSWVIYMHCSWCVTMAYCQVSKI